MSLRVLKRLQIVLKRLQIGFKILGSQNFYDELLFLITFANPLMLSIFLITFANPLMLSMHYYMIHIHTFILIYYIETDGRNKLKEIQN